jgi:2-polyprenyl-3-methyl-5-hydroxy-6-metoxy-1,4-benzoquinol methylase
VITYSDSYKQELITKHKTSRLWGSNVAVSRMDYVSSHLLKLNAHTVLDYGCGKGAVKEWMSTNLPSYDVYEYDPGIEGKDSPPNPADYIICFDVMEHIEPKYVDNVIEHLRGLMLKGGYIYICLLPAHELLPNGSNAHLTIKPAEWWLEKFKNAFEVVENVIQTRGHIGLAITRG